MLTDIEPAIGRLLVSEPFLLDPNFKRSVILIAEHGTEGTLGFILNQKTDILLKDIVPELKDADFPVFVGGPVATDTLHFIHRCYEKMNSGDDLGGGVYWGGNFETLQILLKNNSIDESEIKFFIGYSGWSEGQLNEEIEGNSWIVSGKYAPEILFSSDEEKLWKDVVINMGTRYAHLSNFPQNPNLN